MAVDIDVLNERMNNLISENKKEHGQIMKKLDFITNKLDTLDEDFPTRVEFNSAGDRIKNLENILKGAGGMTMVAVLGALLRLIIK